MYIDLTLISFLSGNAWKESDASLTREQEIQEKLQELQFKCEKFQSKEAENEGDTAEYVVSVIDS